MKLFLNESKKLFIKRKFIFLILAVIVVEFAVFCNDLNNRTNLSEESLAVYEQYITQYAGYVSDEKAEEINKIIEERYFLENEKEDLLYQYSNGEITYEECKSRTKEIEKLLSGQDGFNVFVAEYEDALSSGSYLSDSTLWDELFGQGNADIFVVFTLIVAVIGLWVYDEEAGVNKIRFSSVLGKGNLVVTDMVILFLIAIFFTAILLFGKLFIAEAFFGLQGFDNPISSIEDFSYSELQLSLIDAYLISAAIKIFGGVYAVILAMFLGMIFKSSLYTGFSAFLFIYLPYFVFSKTRLKYILPLPSSYLSADGFLGRIDLSIFTSENDEMVFQSVTSREMLISFGSAAAVILILTVLSYIFWVKRRQVK